MNQKLLYIFFLSILFSYNTPLWSQEVQIETDSISKKKNLFAKIKNYFEEAKIDKSQKKFDLSFIGGPSYSVNTKLGIGLVASGLYRLDKEDLTLAPSFVSLYGNFSTSGFAAIGIEGNTIFPQDKYRVNYNMYFAYMPTRFYGIGYEAGTLNHYSEYDEYQLGLKIDGLKKIIPNFYVGATFSAENYNAQDFKDEHFIPNENKKNTAVGFGYIVSYDSRDFIPNAKKGYFFNLEHIFFTKTLGSNRNFSRITLNARSYYQVWKKGILAFDVNGIFNNGDVPWNMLSLLSDSRQMRGYYKGQYRDRKQINAQVELRQKIYNRHGIALWGGAGNVFKNFDNFDWKHTLPTYGIGYRWEFKDRINVRLDYGIGRGQSGFYFNINESF